MESDGNRDEAGLVGDLNIFQSGLAQGCSFEVRAQVMNPRIRNGGSGWPLIS